MIDPAEAFIVGMTLGLVLAAIGCWRVERGRVMTRIALIAAWAFALGSIVALLIALRLGRTSVKT